MNKTDLIKIVASETGTTQHQTLEIINCMLECIQKILVHGDKVVLRGFGTFQVKTLAPRRIWNPVTDKYINVPERKGVRFEAGNCLKTQVKEPNLFVLIQI